MEIWVLEWSHPNDGENNVTVWERQEDAQRQALKEIADVITNDWDMDDVYASSCADDIDDMVNRGQLGKAISRFNDYQDEHNSDYAQYWFVSKKEVLGANGKRTNEHVHSNGATCRGPCKQHNPYANADKSDGTYVCRQCKTFSSIFGNSP
jgi:hypothetical protein